MLMLCQTIYKGRTNIKVVVLEKELKTVGTQMLDAVQSAQLLMLA